VPLVSPRTQYAGCKIVYFDAGIYIVSETLRIPEDVHVVGEAWSTIMGSGRAFSDTGSPNVVVQVGTEGSTGVAEISSVLFSTRAPGACTTASARTAVSSNAFSLAAGGAIVVEWNVHDPVGQQGAAGMWDTLFRFGGAAGTDMQTAQCGYALGAGTGAACQAAFLGLHITPGASAYLEGTWVWNADHDVEPGGTNVTTFSGRGILSESQGPVWMIGTGTSAVGCGHLLG
jgi:glucan 1,3-beta-glucosidase